MLQYFGVRSVTVFDLDDARLARAEAASATTVLNLSRQVPEVEALVAEYEDQCADFVFDALPHVDAQEGPDARELAMGMLRPGGDYVVYGAAGLPQPISSWMILAKGLRLRATPFDVRAFSMTRSAHVARIALHLVLHGVVDAGSVVTSRLAFEDEAGVRDAFENYGAAGGMKASITTSALPGSPSGRETPREATDDVRQASGSLL
ncbi:zinc-binding dehydrogenase [Streptomyces kaempferi]